MRATGKRVACLGVNGEEVRALLASGLSMLAVSAGFGVSSATVCRRARAEY